MNLIDLYITVILVSITIFSAIITHIWVSHLPKEIDEDEHRWMYDADFYSIKDK